MADDGTQCLAYAARLPLAGLHLGQRGMDLHHLFVDQSVRSRGIGRALVKASKDDARALGCSYFTVGTSADNAAAHPFYLHLGFSDKPLDRRRFSMDLNAAAATIAP